jgi:hypothetical protein
VEGLPHEACLELLRAYGRLERRVT